MCGFELQRSVCWRKRLRAIRIPLTNERKWITKWRWIYGDWSRGWLLRWMTFTSAWPYDSPAKQSAWRDQVTVTNTFLPHHEYSRILGASWHQYSLPLFWDVTSCTLVNRHQGVAVTCSLSRQSGRLLLS